MIHVSLNKLSLPAKEPKNSTDTSLGTWKIVSQPTYASGKPCKEHWTDHWTERLCKHKEPVEQTTSTFIKVEWPGDSSGQVLTCFPDLPQEVRVDKIWKFQTKLLTQLQH